MKYGKCVLLEMAEPSQLMAWREKLEQGSKVEETLELLNTLLESIQAHAEVLQIAAIISPKLLSGFLETLRKPSNKVLLVCAVLSKLFSAIPSSQLAEMRWQWELGLQHPVQDVRRLCLSILKERAGPDPANEPMRELLLQPTLFHLVTQLIADEELKCAQLVSEIILFLAKQPSCLLALTHNRGQSFLIDLEGASSKSSTVRFRVYELAVNLALLGGDAFEFVVGSGLLVQLVGELESDDILVKLNCLEMLTSLMQSEDGVKVLVESDVVKKLHTILATVEQDPFASVLVPGRVYCYNQCIYIYMATA